MLSSTFVVFLLTPPLLATWHLRAALRWDCFNWSLSDVTQEQHRLFRIISKQFHFFSDDIYFQICFSLSHPAHKRKEGVTTFAPWSFALLVVPARRGNSVLGQWQIQKGFVLRPF